MLFSSLSIVMMEITLPPPEKKKKKERVKWTEIAGVGAGEQVTEGRKTAVFTHRIIIPHATSVCKKDTVKDP